MSAGLIEVRIRASYNTLAAHLTKWPIADLDSLFPALKRWGVFVDGDDQENVYGQVTVEEGAAYFEIIVGADDA